VRTLVNTLAVRSDLRGDLMTWPLGGPAVEIGADLTTTRRGSLGGNQVLQDDRGGTWVWFSAVRVAARVPAEEMR
jgi:hypothetical protein